MQPTDPLRRSCAACAARLQRGRGLRQSFRVSVTGSEASLTIRQLAGGLMQVNIHGDVGLSYDLEASSNLRDWSRLPRFRLETSPHP